jgi:hypothetical protein
MLPGVIEGSRSQAGERESLIQLGLVTFLRGIQATSALA